MHKEIPKRKKLWDKIPSQQTIYLRKRVANRIVCRAIRKAGSKGYLVKHVLLSPSKVPDVTFLEKVANGERGLKKYRWDRLVRYLGLDLKKIESSIVAIGRKDRRNFRDFL